MARLPRLCPAGVPQHIIQRGNNRQACVGSTNDYAMYARWLKIYSKEFNVGIHAWVFMTNHVHLLATPNSDDGVSLMMQSLGRRYVRYFNRSYRRNGTLWEGRFKSCVVEQEEYLLSVYRYIDLNPVRAKMVDDPSSYIWSSYRCNTLESESRKASYRSLFNDVLDSDVIRSIRDSVQKELALGSNVLWRQPARTD